MKLTIDSDEPLEDVLKVIGAMYQVDLGVRGNAGRATTEDGDAEGDDEGGWRTKTRHL
ncbi:hypothetical protein [Georgenia subflava]|uniref:hypothetical protein n=1 Tax=Georgenia subflava TaxID=1622177 RepID=UPI00186B1258|nr:hypothetical protein [Georgenia subflava]